MIGIEVRNEIPENTSGMIKVEVAGHPCWIRKMEVTDHSIKVWTLQNQSRVLCKLSKSPLEVGTAYLLISNGKLFPNCLVQKLGDMAWEQIVNHLHLEYQVALEYKHWFR